MAASIIIFMVPLITPALSNSIIHEYTEYCVPPYGYYYPNHTNPNYTLIYSVEPLRPIERCCPECNHCKHLGGSCILKWAYYIYPKCCDFYPIEPCKDYSCVCCIRCGDDKCSPCVQTGGECRVECRTNELEDKTNQCSYYNDGSGCKCCKRCEANYECIEAYGICATDPEWCPYGTYASTGCCGGCYCCKPVWTPVKGGQCDSYDGAYCSETDECAPGYYPCFGECFASYYSGGHTRIEQGYCCVPKKKTQHECPSSCILYHEGLVLEGRCYTKYFPGLKCNGTCGNYYHCQCCIDTNVPTCPNEPETEYSVLIGNKYFSLYTIALPWNEALAYCMNESMVLAEPQDPLELAALQTYILDHGLSFVWWLGGHGNGSKINWLSGGPVYHPQIVGGPSAPEWWTGEPFSVSEEWCLIMNPESTAGGPLAVYECGRSLYFICECVHV